MQSGKLFDILSYQAEHYPQDLALSDLFEGNLRSYSIEELEKLSNQIAHGLQKLGLKPGDKIAIVVYRNRVEFTLLDLAIQKCGMISVPLYASISPKEYTYILAESECKCVFFGGGDLAEKIKEAQTALPDLEFLFALDADGEGIFWESIWKNALQEPLDVSAIDPSEVFTIIYTSGTTGHPKGVMLSHTNVLENIYAVVEIVPLSVGAQIMSFLPLCHIFERTASFAYLLQGVQVTYTGIDNLGGEEGDLQRVQPQFLTCVPRLLEKIYERIYQKGLMLTGLKKKLFFWALSLTDEYRYDVQFRGVTRLKWYIADKLIFSKWRAAFGGRVEGILTASAPCPIKIARVFSAAGIPIREAYGLTESSPGLSINGLAPGMAMLGTVGPPLSNVEISIDKSDGSYAADEGEILAAGPNIMLGYYKKPSETDAVIKEINGKRWLLTGDIGKMVTSPTGRKFLKITDRKKELLKTSAGKYVAPAPIESKMKEHILVEQAMVVGDGQKYASAIITPAPEALARFCAGAGLKHMAHDERIQHKTVLNKFDEIISSVNQHFARHEQIKRYQLVVDSWTMTKADGTPGELTPTLKLKRRVLLAKYAPVIDELYH
ncbi:MAG: long-chain fatty acid--CoA ligase [Saprospiraceae bacterium]|nr:long-chain fatty acid--CoA ligase [Saprospiraceae bacterium]